MGLKLVSTAERLDEDLPVKNPKTKATKAPKPKPKTLLEWAGATVNDEGELVPKKRRKRQTYAASAFHRARAEAQEMMKSRDWSGCAPRHLLALYDLMHAKTYGVEPTMSAKERHTAVIRVGGFVQREFEGDFERAIDYFRWVWMREIDKEAWRRREGREVFCLSFGMTISGRSITDYRVALLRKK